MAATRPSNASQRAAWTSSHRAVAGLTATIGVVGATWFYSVSGPIKADIFMTSTGLMLALMFVGIALFRRDHLRAWGLVAAGLTSAYVAMFLMNYGSWFGLSFGQPSVLDALMLANYPLAALGGLAMMTRHHRRTGMHALLETVTLTIAGGLLIFVFVGVRATESAIGAPASIVAALYPLGNVLLLAVLVTVVVRLRERAGGIALVALGFAGNLAADLISTWQKLAGTYEPGGWVDFGYLLCFIGLSAAPAWPDRGRRFVDNVDVDEGQVTAGRMAILLVALFSAPVILVVQQLRGADASDTVAIVGTIVVLALALARIALYHQDLRRKESALRVAHDELAQSEHDKQALLWRLNEAVEEERKRIAAEIHDRPVQQLAALGYKIETIALALMGDDVDRAVDLTDEVADELSEQLVNLRNLMVEVRPPVLDERGLVGALVDAASTFQTDYPAVRVSVRGHVDELDPDVETALYRVAQEALTNIAKHAAASSVVLGVHESDTAVELTIRDDGRGFDVSGRARFVGDGHFGLAGMEERVAMLDGSMTVDSEPGTGTFIVCHIPTTRQPALTTAGAN